MLLRGGRVHGNPGLSGKFAMGGIEEKPGLPCLLSPSSRRLPRLHLGREALLHGHQIVHLQALDNPPVAVIVPKPYPASSPSPSGRGFHQASKIAV
jgi:hypothetical protein